MRATWLIGLALVAGCGRQLNPEYCHANPTDPDCQTAGLISIDAAPSCHADSDCTTAGATVCDTASGSCVACTQAENACTAPTGVCNTDDTCVQCNSGSNCPSGVCHPDNTCAQAGTILYATPGGDTTGDCSEQGSACTLTYALTLANATKSTIQLATGDYAEGTIKLDVAGLQLVVAAGANVSFSNGDPVLDVTASVTMGDFTIDQAGGDAIDCSSNATMVIDHVVVSNSNKDAISVNGCTATISQSKISGTTNTAMDFGGNTTISIRNNFIWAGGNALLTDGAINIGGNVTGDIRFNTIAFNTALKAKVFGREVDYPAGFNCSSGANVNVSDNLFADNEPITYAEGFGSPCGNNPTNANWIGDSGDVHFLSGSSPYDLHLTSSTPNNGDDPIRDNANTNCSDVKNDIDNDVRPFGGACDYGGDEFTTM